MHHHHHKTGTYLHSYRATFTWNRIPQRPITSNTHIQTRNEGKSALFDYIFPRAVVPMTRATVHLSPGNFGGTLRNNAINTHRSRGKSPIVGRKMLPGVYPMIYGREGMQNVFRRGPKENVLLEWTFHCKCGGGARGAERGLGGALGYAYDMNGAGVRVREEVLVVFWRDSHKFRQVCVCCCCWQFVL